MIAGRTENNLHLKNDAGEQAMRFSPLLKVPLLVLLILSSCNHSPQEGMEYTNPVLAGFYPDPSICRVGDDYYLVNSTFAYYPGIPVFHSKDLVNWKLIGYVIDRPNELDYDTLGVSRGIFAPAIRYFQGLFYVTCTFVDGGGNFIVTAKDPAGPWSNVTWLPQVDGIDPSLFFDDNGRAYLVYNSVAPDNKPLYEGHRTIRMRGFDVAGLRVMDDARILVNGGTDIAKKPVWIEGPHIFKVEGQYYLIAAEGGTAEDHSEVVFKSENVAGPYVPYQGNPILTQRDLDPERKNPITCTGHADFVETPGGAWWAVFLGCQPYPPSAENYYNTGRETFLAPVTWKDGWPTIVPHGQVVANHYPYPLPSAQEKEQLRYGGSFDYTDDFSSDKLDLNWEFLRAPKENWYSLTKKPGFLSMQLRPETCGGKGNPSFLGRRQQHANSSGSTAMQFAPKHDNEKAGLLVFQNETHFYYVCESLDGGQPVIQLYKSSAGAGEMQLLASRKLSWQEGAGEIHLRIDSHGSTYSFLCSLNGGPWETVKERVDGTFLSTKVAGGFVGCMYALYSTSLGKPSESNAYFDWFTYQGNH
jgi:xylan 1,4-beta-xylosidase